MARAYMTDASATADGGRNSRGQLRRPGWGGPGMWRRGLLSAAVAVLLALAFVLHAKVPNSFGNLGSLWETFLPWGGLLIPVLLVLALVRRAPVALLALLLPVGAWANLFAGQFTDKSGGRGDFAVVTHNVNAENPDPAGTARELSASGAEVIALEEITTPQAGTYEKELGGAYPHHKRVGTVGLWSKYPMKDTRTVDIKMGWPRAMRSTVAAPQGDVAVYTAHLPSVRVQFRSGFTAGQRDDSADALGEAIARDSTERIVLIGDLNGTMNDRSLAPITSQMRSAQGAAGDGPGFSWPAAFPLTRIDQIMVRGMEPVSSWSLKGTGSDHLPVAASLDF